MPKRKNSLSRYERLKKSMMLGFYKTLSTIDITRIRALFIWFLPTVIWEDNNKKDKISDLKHLFNQVISTVNRNSINSVNEEKKLERNDFVKNVKHPQTRMVKLIWRVGIEILRWSKNIKGWFVWLRNTFQT